MVKVEEIKKILKNHEKRISKLEARLKGSGGSSIRRVNKRKSITDLLIELKNDGFFKQPKFLKQIVDKLSERSYHYSPTSLTEPLQRAIRARILGRVKKDGKWAYVAR